MKKKEKLTFIHDKQNKIILSEQLWRDEYCH